ncbi:MAG: glycosyltransferase family 4 protein [Acidobacteriota bacterium]
MRVLQISSARSIGGGERHVVDLTNELTERGHDIFVAVVPGSPLPTALSRVPPRNMAEFPLRNALDVSSAIKIARFARQYEIELINAHFAKDYPIAALAARIAHIPFIVTRHVLFPMNRLHRFFLRTVKYVIAPSNAVAKSLRSQRLFPDEKVVTIRYGLDMARFPQRRTLDREGICIGSIGNLDPVKGFDLLIRSAGIISARRQDVRFSIVGEDRSRDGHNEKLFRGLIAELNLNDAVELTGWSDDITEVLAGLDIFVSASRSESFGFVLAEAMLSGVPVIATETEGAKEIISDPSLGQLVPVDSPERLADAILHLLNDRQKRDQLAKYGREHVQKHFSLRRMVDETEALYRKAIGDQ